MNKIIVNRKDFNIWEDDSYLFQENKSLVLEVENLKKEITLTVCPNCIVSLTIFARNSNFSFSVELEKDSQLEMNLLLVDGNCSFQTVLKEERAEFILHSSMISKSSQTHHIAVLHQASNTISKVHLHGLSSHHAALVLDVTTSIPKNAKNCIASQDSQIIELSPSLSQIQPNLYIENYEVEASHAAYIGELKEEQLFYLMSRGITKKDAKLLLLKAFLLGHFHLSEEQQQKQERLILSDMKKEVEE